MLAPLEGWRPHLGEILDPLLATPIFIQISSYPPMGSTTIPLGDTNPSMDKVRLFPS